MPDFFALRTVPLLLRNVTRTLNVNALLDDATTKTYLNADVAAELRMLGQAEKVNVIKRSSSKINKACLL